MSGIPKGWTIQPANEVPKDWKIVPADQAQAAPAGNFPPTLEATEEGARAEGDPTRHKEVPVYNPDTGEQTGTESVAMSPEEQAATEQLETREAPGAAATFGNQWANTVSLHGAPRLGALYQSVATRGTPGMSSDFRERYMEALRRNQEDLERGATEHSTANKFGIGAGILNQLALTRGGAAPDSLGAALDTAVKGGIIYGGVGGLVSGKGADTLNPKQAALDTGTGMIAGGATAIPLAITGYGVSKVPEVARYIGGKLQDWGINAGRRFLQSGRGTMTAKVPLSDEAVSEAVNSGALKFGSGIERTYERLSDVAEERGQLYGQVVQKLKDVGFKGPEAEELAAKWRMEGAIAKANSSAESQVPRLYAKQAANISTQTPAGQQVQALSGSGQFTPEQARAIVARNPAMTSDDWRLGLTQAENIKRSLQQKGLYEKLLPTDAQGAKMDMASDMRQAVEDAISEQAPNATPEMQRVAEAFVPVKRSLGPILEAQRAALEGKTRMANRSGIGLRDTILAGGELAAGKPFKAMATLGVTKALRERGPSMAAVTGIKGGQALDDASRSTVARYIGGLMSEGAASPAIPGQAGAAVSGGTDDNRHP